jgi:Na+/H+ antiporter NhaD/arsenite permease-like protein
MDRTDLERRAWRARRVASGTAARARRMAVGVALGAALVLVAIAGHALLGRLGDPFALLVVLPPFAIGLAAFGFRDVLAIRIAAIRSPEVRLIGAYGLWLVTSAFLTLEVAAVASGSVAMAVGRDREERRWQLGAAVLGSNVGSLLFPFSNLTNLVLVAGSGIGLGAYLAASIPAQLAAAVACGALLLVRFADARDAEDDRVPAADDPPIRYLPARRDTPWTEDRNATFAAGIAAAVALTAIVAGFTGASMVWPFVAGGAILAAWAVGSGRVEPRRIVEAAPLVPLAIVVVAALAAGPIAVVAGLLPKPHVADPLTLLAVMVAGGALAATVNNLPAAAFGAVWLGGAPVPVLVAWLVGTNVAALVTPHGSVATLLARAAARRHGPTSSVGDYLGAAWRYAAVASVAAIACLVLVRL